MPTTNHLAMQPYTCGKSKSVQSDKNGQFTIDLDADAQLHISKPITSTNAFKLQNLKVSQSSANHLSGNHCGVFIGTAQKQHGNDFTSQCLKW